MKRHLMTVLLAAAAATAMAQAPAPAPAPTESAAARYQDGLRLQAKGDERGAFLAFLESAEGGYPPAQRRMGEIYDSSKGAVVRNYPESIRWYQKAREAGEPVPQQKPRMQGLIEGR
jgi:TPR repeat protein